MNLPEMSYEEAFARLDELVRVLERGELSLAEMLAAYEESVQLSRHCTELLDAAELRISQLVKNDDGEYEVVPLDGTALT